MRALVHGFGSIGARHARVLAELGAEVAVVSGHAAEDGGFPVFRALSPALHGFRPDYVVIAQATHRHHDVLSEVDDLGFSGTVLVEKPLFHRELPFEPRHLRKLFVGYNLRFHPVLRRLAELVEGEEILSVTAYVGQYLPTWRPESDYRRSYSARRGSGGVLRDLSHELDYLAWLFGRWQRVAAIGGHYSALEIDSDDSFSLLLSTQKCPALTLTMNYLDREGRRFILVNGRRGTAFADLVAGTVQVGSTVERFETERDGSYRAMHRAVLENDERSLCRLEEGKQTLELIAAAEEAAAKGCWVDR